MLYLLNDKARTIVRRANIFDRDIKLDMKGGSTNFLPGMK